MTYDALLAQKLTQPGTIAVILTDTVYGVVARATDPAAVERLYRLKRRENKPGTLIAAAVDQLVALGIKRRYLQAVERYWPGAVSVIIPCGEEMLYLHQGVQSLAVRIPDDASLHVLLERTGPLITSSANQPGELPARTIAEAKAYFGDTVDLYVDGGDVAGRKPSTVIRVVDDVVEVIREGAVKIDPDTGAVIK